MEHSRDKCGTAAIFPSRSGVRHICHNVISQVSLSRDDVVFAVLQVPVSLQIYSITHGIHSYPAWSWRKQSNVCFEVPIKRGLRAQEEALDFRHSAIDVESSRRAPRILSARELCVYVSAGPPSLLRLTLQIHVARRAPRFLYVSKSSSGNSSGGQDMWVAKTVVWTPWTHRGTHPPGVAGGWPASSSNTQWALRHLEHRARKVSKSKTQLRSVWTSFSLFLQQ